MKFNPKSVGETTETTLPPSVLRVLGVILEETARAGHAVGIGVVQRRLGHVSKNWIHEVIHRLREAGLVRFEKGLTNTLQPACRYEPV